jgi:hypothetical protein
LRLERVKAGLPRKARVKLARVSDLVLGLVGGRGCRDLAGDVISGLGAVAPGTLRISSDIKWEGQGAAAS